MSQARHVNCKWQSLSTKESSRRKIDKHKSDKLALEKPTVAKDELVKYFKKYGAVVASCEIGSQLIIQFDGVEPVDLALELQTFDEHQVRGHAFNAERWFPTEKELKLWEELSGTGNKRKAAPVVEGNRAAKQGKAEPGVAAPVLVDNPFAAEKKAASSSGVGYVPAMKGERNEFGHLPGCECSTCKKLGAVLQTWRDRQDIIKPPAPPAELEEPPQEQWPTPPVMQPPNPFGHLPICICPKCRRWAAGGGIEDELEEEEVKQSKEPPALHQKPPKVAVQPPQGGHLPGCLCPKCRGRPEEAEPAQQGRTPTATSAAAFAAPAASWASHRLPSRHGHGLGRLRRQRRAQLCALQGSRHPRQPRGRMDTSQGVFAKPAEGDLEQRRRIDLSGRSFRLQRV